MLPSAYKKAHKVCFIVLSTSHAVLVEVHKGLEVQKGNKVRLVEVLVGGAGKQQAGMVLHMLVPSVPVQCM